MGLQTNLPAEEVSVTNWLSGKKTYIVAVVAFVGSLVHAWATNDWASFTPYVAFSSAVASLRAAVAKVGQP